MTRATGDVRRPTCDVRRATSDVRLPKTDNRQPTSPSRFALVGPVGGRRRTAHRSPVVGTRTSTSESNVALGLKVLVTVAEAALPVAQSLSLFFHDRRYAFRNLYGLRFAQALR
jgi:hypothetical protein